MEHIVQFAIDIDDGRIVDMIEKNAEKTITKELCEKVADVLFKRPYGYCSNAEKRDPTSYATAKFEQFLELHKDEIISGCVKVIADKVMKSKSFKDKITGGVEDACANGAAVYDESLTAAVYCP